ncbi:MAG: hypothetical protein EH224_03825 [Calditrichaeota bacterium]|nr:MAG: hypothetical protein EH224_03825 [Calditrichota bacterium]
MIGFTDGKDMKMLLPSQDHKPAFDDDRGPNTGGMGAYCPVPFCDEKQISAIRRAVIEPTLEGIRSERMNYKGAIYFGLMMTEKGPSLLEYNVRFGDPETEVILPSLKTNFLELIISCLEGRLSEVNMDFHPGYYVDVVLASGGYPGSYEKGKVIKGLDKIDGSVFVFHAGTKKENNNIVTSGGRVLNVVANGVSLESAIEKAYKEVKKIEFDRMFYRSDIGRKGLMKR